MRRGLIITGSIIVGVVLILGGMWLGSRPAKQSTPAQQTLVQKKPAKKVATAKTKAPTPTVTAVNNINIYPSPAPASVPAPVSTTPVIQNSINVYPPPAPLPAPWPYGPTRWVPGYQRWVCEGPPGNLKCYWTWEPAHYE